jgi:ligand-binding sensor domain-containing protein
LRRIVFIAISFLLALSSFSQQARQYFFSHLTTAEGLASNFVNSVVQDKDGYIWIGTINGLQRYDGNSFTTFSHKKNNLTSIPSDLVQIVYRDKKQRMWIVSADNSVGIFDTRSFKYIDVPFSPKGKSKVYIEKYFLETAAGEVYLHERKTAFYKYDERTGKFTIAGDLVPAPKGWLVDQIQYDNSIKKYWAAADSGIVLYDPTTKHLNYRGHNIDNDPAIKAFEKGIATFNIFLDSKSNIYFYSWPPATSIPIIHKYERQANSYKQYSLQKEIGLKYHEIIQLLEQRNGRLWIMGNPFIAEWRNGPTPFLSIPNEYKSPQSIKFDRITFSYEDRQNNVWIATDNGLYYFNPNAELFDNYSLIKADTKQSVEGAVQTVLETNDKMLVSTWNNGFYCYDRNMSSIRVPPSITQFAPLNPFWDMLKHSMTGNIWLVQQAGSLIVYNPLKEKAAFYKPDVVNKSTIRQVVEDKQGDIWLGTQSGKIIKWNHNGNNPANGYSLVYQGGRVYKLFIDNKGFLWAGTEKGLLKINTSTGAVVKTFTESGATQEQLSKDAVSEIIQYDDSTLIALAGSINIIHLNTNKVTWIGTPEGLPSNSAVSGVKDADGILWLGMVNGLCRVNLKKKLFSLYDKRDGITYDNFDVASAYNLSNNRILFTTSHNFFIFNPAAVTKASTPLPATITQLIADNRIMPIDSVMQQGALTLPYAKNAISIAFSALNYTRQKKLNYYYMLEGLNKEWILSTSTKVDYNYLPPGKYKFKVRTENADGIMSGESVSFPIIIRAAFWRTWWFYALIFLVVVAGLFAFDRERMNRIRAVEQTRVTIASSLHEEINTGLKNINILSEMAKIKWDEDMQRSKEMVDQISQKSFQMVVNIDDLLWTINPGNDDFKNTIDRLHEFISALKSRYEAYIKMEVDKDVYALKLSMQIRHDFYVVLREVLRLAVVTGNGKSVLVNIDLVKPTLIAKVKEETITIDINQTSIAKKIDELKKKVAAIGGELDIERHATGFSATLIIKV